MMTVVLELTLQDLKIMMNFHSISNHLSEITMELKDKQNKNMTGMYQKENIYLQILVHN